MQRESVVDLDGRAKIDWRVLIDLDRQRLVRIVVAFVLKLQGQRVPGRLIFDAAEGRRAATEHAANRELPAVTAAGITTAAETITHHVERISEVATIAQIAPAEPQAEIEIAVAFAGDEIFRAEQASTAKISQPHRDFRLIAAFFPQSELGIEGFIQIVAIRCGGAIADGFD